jgi:endonuclease/exonuclease/phosphatase (EEP) superfamily protein YafD
VCRMGTGTDDVDESAPRRRIRWWGWALAALPWLWFAIWNRDGLVDQLAVALPVIGAVALALALLLLARRLRLGALVAASVVAVCLVATVLPRIPQATGAPRRPIDLVSANVFEYSQWPGRAAATMASRGADVIVSVEIGRSYWRHLADYAPRYPYGIASGAQGVRSKYPLTFLPLPAGLPADRMLRVRIDRPGAPFVIYAVHLLNPLHETTFADQREVVRRLIAAADDEPIPAVIAGDLNLSDRIGSYRMLDGSMRDAMRAQAWPPRTAWTASTYLAGIWRLLMLRIDHVFMPEDWCARDPATFGVPGSDHAGLQVQIGPCTT